MRECALRASPVIGGFFLVGAIALALAGSGFRVIGTGTTEAGAAALDQALAIAEEICQRFFALFGNEPGRWSFREHQAFLAQHGRTYDSLLRAIELVGLQLKLVENGPDEIDPLIRRLKEYSERLRFWMENVQTSFVYWVEKRVRGCYLQATPIEVSSILNEKLFEVVDTVVLTSATLAVAGSFEYSKDRLGAHNARCQIVDSPFDYAKQALLYVPPHMPDPRNAGFAAAALEEILRLLEFS